MNWLGSQGHELKCQGHRVMDIEILWSLELLSHCRDLSVSDVSAAWLAAASTIWELTETAAVWCKDGGQQQDWLLQHSAGSQRALNRLQRVMNAAAWLVCHSGRLTPVYGLLRDRLHWLRVPEWVRYKLCHLVFRSVRGTAPDYLTIKRWRRCSFSAPLSSTQGSPGSTFKDQLWWSCVCSRRTSVMEQTTSNSLVIWQSAEL